MPGDYLLYDYTGIETVAAELTTANANASTLLATGTANRATLALSWQGTSQVAFDDAFNRFSLANQNIIDTTAAAILALETGNAEMQVVETTYAGGFV